MKNYVDHNTSVGFAFPQSHVGENACERTLSWDFLCLCRLSSYGFYCLPQGSNTDERSTLLLSLNSLCCWRMFVSPTPNSRFQCPARTWKKSRRLGRRNARVSRNQRALNLKTKDLIGYLWTSLFIDQSECLVCYLCMHSITSFLHCVKEKLHCSQPIRIE